MLELSDYLKYRRAQISASEEYEGISQSDISSIILGEWRAMTDAEKIQFKKEIKTEPTNHVPVPRVSEITSAVEKPVVGPDLISLTSKFDALWDSLPNISDSKQLEQLLDVHEVAKNVVSTPKSPPFNIRRSAPIEKEEVTKTAADDEIAIKDWIRILTPQSKYRGTVGIVRGITRRNTALEVSVRSYSKREDGAIQYHDTTLGRGWKKLNEKETQEAIAEFIPPKAPQVIPTSQVKTGSQSKDVNQQGDRTSSSELLPRKVPHIVPIPEDKSKEGSPVKRKTLIELEVGDWIRIGKIAAKYHDCAAQICGDMTSAMRKACSVFVYDKDMNVIHTQKTSVAEGGFVEMTLADVKETEAWLSSHTVLPYKWIKNKSKTNEGYDDNDEDEALNEEKDKSKESRAMTVVPKQLESKLKREDDEDEFTLSDAEAEIDDNDKVTPTKSLPSISVGDWVRIKSSSKKRRLTYANAVAKVLRTSSSVVKAEAFVEESDCVIHTHEIHRDHGALEKLSAEECLEIENWIAAHRVNHYFEARKITKLSNDDDNKTLSDGGTIEDDNQNDGGLEKNDERSISIQKGEWVRVLVGKTESRYANQIAKLLGMKNQRLRLEVFILDDDGIIRTAEIIRNENAVEKLTPERRVEVASWVASHKVIRYYYLKAKTSGSTSAPSQTPAEPPKALSPSPSPAFLSSDNCTSTSTETSIKVSSSHPVQLVEEIAESSASIQVTSVETADSSSSDEAAGSSVVNWYAAALSLKSGDWIRITDANSKYVNEVVNVSRVSDESYGQYIFGRVYVKYEDGGFDSSQIHFPSDKGWVKLGENDIAKVGEWLQIDDLALGQKRKLEAGNEIMSEEETIQVDDWIRITNLTSKYCGEVAKIMKIKDMKTGRMVFCDPHVESEDGCIRTHTTSLREGWKKLSSKEVREINNWLWRNKVILHM